ncbi:Serine/threonine-protein kinase smg1 [Mortierella alpina]|nr:Serine/threonine-protein kinase smg1 [Mortierella alpina]
MTSNRSLTLELILSSMVVGRAAVDFASAVVLLEDIEDVLDRSEDSSSLLPTLDQLLDLSVQHPEAWQPRFQAIVDLLVGWHVDRGTTAAVRRRIGDVLGSFTVQWSSAADFGQDLLEYFINDIEALAAEEATSDGTATNETISCLQSCFQIIVKALISHASLASDRLKQLQEHALDMLVAVAGASEAPNAPGMGP